MPIPSTDRTDPRRRQTGDPALLRALAEPATYRGHGPVLVHETHASWVFVTGDRAFKVKKPLALGFLDYSTLERRRSACREEVRINRELAPDVYLGVRAIVRSADGFRLTDEDSPDAIEYAVEMRRFNESDTLAGLIETRSLTRAHVAEVAEVLASFHRSAAVVADWEPERMLEVWRRNVAELEEVDHPGGWRLDVVAAFGEAFLDGHAQELRRRALLGLIRDGHGDLRCEHVLARPTVRVVDRIEFDPRLRQIDVACDLAFLAMDLEAYGQPWAARELISAYRRVGIDPGGQALRSFYSSHWAFVRAKVALIAAAERGRETGSEHALAAQRLWSLGERLCWRARAPLAITICGPAASGKSTLARELSRRSAMPVVCSDVVRKRLAHLDEHQPARAQHYSARFTRATYEQLGRDALLALRRNGGVIVDATCRSRDARALVLAKLAESGARLLVVRCELPLEQALQRAGRRLHDPQRISDATPQIAQQQFDAFDELEEMPEEQVLRLDTTKAADAQIAELTRALDSAGSGG